MEMAAQINSVESPYLNEEAHRKSFVGEGRGPPNLSDSLALGKLFRVVQPVHIDGNFAVSSESDRYVDVGPRDQCATTEGLKHLVINVLTVKEEKCAPPAMKMVPVPRISRNTGKGPFTCIECGKLFKSPQIWKIHVLNHSFRSKSHKAEKDTSDPAGSFGAQSQTSQTAAGNKHTWPANISKGNQLDENQQRCKNAPKTVYGCNECYELFVSQEVGGIQKNQYSGLKPFKCQKLGCEASYVQIEALWNHKTKKHKVDFSDSNELNCCAICNRALIPSDAVEIHINENNSLKPFKCQKFGCTASFAHVGSLWTHTCKVHKLWNKLNHYAVPDATTKASLACPKTCKIKLKCHQCKIWVWDRASLRAHVRRVHGDNDEMYIPKVNIAKTKTAQATRLHHSNTENSAPALQDDGEQFISKTCKDDVTVLPSKVPVIKPALTELRTPDHKSASNELAKLNGKTPCDNEKPDEKRYVNSTTILRPFKCKEYGCDAAYAHVGSLWNHTAYIHKRRYRDKLSTSGKRRRLVKSSKCSKEVYKCFECNKVLPSSKHLEIHVSAHKPHKCNENQCSAAFSYSSSLTNHKLTVHGELINFKCRQCNVRYKSRATLHAHVTRFHKRPMGVYYTSSSNPAPKLAAISQGQFQKSTHITLYSEAILNSEWRNIHKNSDSNPHMRLGLEQKPNFSNKPCWNFSCREVEPYSAHTDRLNGSDERNQPTGEKAQNPDCAREVLSFICELCGARIVQCAKYIEHIVQHAKDQDLADRGSCLLQQSDVCRYICGQCGISFQLRMCLHKHLLIHAGERG